MSVVKVRNRYQLTIPAEVREELGLKIGDYVEVSVQRGKVVLVPQERVDQEDAWFWSELWQEKEREADEALAKGQVIGPFENAQQSLKALKQSGA